MNKRKILRVAVTGPESTGKSTLAKKLAKYFNTIWVPEYARTYIDQLGRPYEQHDLLEIAKGQIEAEDSLIHEANNLLFCDTELLVIKIWSEYKYGTVDSYILSEINKRFYDLYLLLDVDLPWVNDSQREHPENRAYFFGLFEKELKKMGANYFVISGGSESRFNGARKHIESLLNISKNFKGSLRIP